MKSYHLVLPCFGHSNIDRVLFFLSSRDLSKPSPDSAKDKMYENRTRSAASGSWISTSLPFPSEP